MLDAGDPPSNVIHKGEFSDYYELCRLANEKRAKSEKLNEQEANAFQAMHVYSRSIKPSKNMLYGLADARRVYLAFHQGNVDKCTIDALNASVFGPGIAMAVPKPEEYQADRIINDSSFGADAKEFRYFLHNHKRYNPKLISGEEYPVVRLKRACKAGLDFTAKRGGQVTFLLDGIDMDSVVDKNQKVWENPITFWGDSNNKPKPRLNNILGPKKHEEPVDSMTSSELRHIYRRRNDEKFMKSIKFFKDGTPVAPPWNETDSAWSRYKPKQDSVYGRLKKWIKEKGNRFR